MAEKIIFFDSTLRDGSHAIRHQIKREWIAEYCRQIDTAGMDVIYVGHGNGLGASSLQVGLALLSEEEMLTTARENLSHTPLGAFMIPGFGTIKDNLIPAMDYGVEVFNIASHCTEANVTRQHIEYCKNHGKRTYGVLMSYHMAETSRLVEEAKKMESYGADGLILMDSAGASTPDMVKNTIQQLVDHLQIPVGFHGHNNLDLAVSNSLTAVRSGAKIIDGTVKGFGAGAGNCPLEVLVALFQKLGIPTNTNLYRLLDVGDSIVTEMAGKPIGVDSLCVVSGMAGVFSAFASHVKKAAIRFNVDPRDIFMELGKRKVVGGQEDVIVDVAMNIAQIKKHDDTSYLLESLL